MTQAFIAEEGLARVHFGLQVSTVGTQLQAKMLKFCFPW